jgi:hypothetical protein
MMCEALRGLLGGCAELGIAANADALGPLVSLSLGLCAGGA